MRRVILGMNEPGGPFLFARVGTSPQVIEKSAPAGWCVVWPYEDEREEITIGGQTYIVFLLIKRG